MKANYTHIVILIDRSGSMSSIQKDMEGGLKDFLAKQKKLPGKCTITAAQFDTSYDLLHSLRLISEVEEIRIDPRGGTALIDSMVRLIREAGRELADLPEDERPDRVLFITITDGEENSSREYKNEDLKTLIKEQEDKYKWNFTYLGANQDAFSVAMNLGVAFDHSITYNASERGVDFMFATLNNATTRYRKLASNEVDGASFTYTKEEQENTKDA